MGLRGNQPDSAGNWPAVLSKATENWRARGRGRGGPQSPEPGRDGRSIGGTDSVCNTALNVLEGRHLACAVFPAQAHPELRLQEGSGDRLGAS